MARDAAAPVGAEILEERVVEIDRAVDVERPQLAGGIVEGQEIGLVLVGAAPAPPKVNTIASDPAHTTIAPTTRGSFHHVVTPFTGMRQNAAKTFQRVTVGVAPRVPSRPPE